MAYCWILCPPVFSDQATNPELGTTLTTSRKFRTNKMLLLVDVVLSLTLFFMGLNFVGRSRLALPHFLQCFGFGSAYWKGLLYADRMEDAEPGGKKRQKYNWGTVPGGTWSKDYAKAKVRFFFYKHWTIGCCSISWYLFFQ